MSIAVYVTTVQSEHSDAIQIAYREAKMMFDGFAPIVPPTEFKGLNSIVILSSNSKTHAENSADASRRHHYRQLLRSLNVKFSEVMFTDNGANVLHSDMTEEA